MMALKQKFKVFRDFEILNKPQLQNSFLHWFFQGKSLILTLTLKQNAWKIF